MDEAEKAVPVEEDDLGELPSFLNRCVRWMVELGSHGSNVDSWFAVQRSDVARQMWNTRVVIAQYCCL